MEALLRYPWKYVNNTSNHQSITAKLVETLNATNKKDFFPETYFYLTHLINPINAYWTKLSPLSVANSNETARKLFLGQKIERLASIWFKKLPDFIVEQGKLDGAFVGIPGVVGKFDFLIGDSIIELKSKDELPKDDDEIVKLYPQDIEQLAFYSVLHPMQPKENYLVFINQSHPYKFKAFKLITTDFGKIKSMILSRISHLKSSIEKKEFISLGRCRYFELGCKFRENNICSCGSLELISDTITTAVKLLHDDEFTKLLQSEMEKSKFKGDAYTILDLIIPRKKIMKDKLNISEEEFSDMKREGYLSCLDNLVKRLPYKPTKEQKKKIKEGIFDDRLIIAQRWLNLPSSSKAGGELVPYTIEYGRTTYQERASKPEAYHIGKLAIICASYGVSKGIIIIIYPNLNDLIHTFEINFKNLKEVQTEIKGILDQLDKAMEDGEFLSLEPCLKFFNNDGKCPLMKPCHSGKNKGCDPYYVPVKL
ncbi:hypothetical protein HYX02_01515 [Candidatus Woesearchaeota archaeon]|nr:hypothetical protein [Candidatus Woesearchaeota archaeon]